MCCIGAGLGVRPHPVVHCGNEQHGRLRGEEARSEQIIRLAGGGARHEVRRRRRDHYGVRRACQVDVVERAARVEQPGVHWPTGERFEGDAPNELRSGARENDVDFRTGYDKWLAYGQSKTANVLFAVELDKLARDKGIRAFALHPGAIMTNLGRHMSEEDWSSLGFVDENGNVIAGMMKSVPQGAATQAWAATSRQLDGLGGVYLEDCEVAEVQPDSDLRVGVRDYAIDPEQATRLWALSAELTATNAFAR